MNSFKQVLLFIYSVQHLQLLVTSKPIFKGLSFKKNYEFEISAIPFKHISFIKQKWFPFKMIGVKHDIEKREVVENPTDEHLYSVNEVTFDNEQSDKLPGLLTSVNQNLDLNSDGEIIENPAPVVENVESIDVNPVIEPKSLAAGIMQTSSIIPLNPSIVIAPSIQTTGGIVQPATIVPLNTEVAVPVSKETEIQSPVIDKNPIQPLHTHIDIPSVEKLEENISKMHTDISSVVPMNTMVENPVKETDIVSTANVKVETPIVEPPKVVEEVKIEPVVEPPVVNPPAIIPGIGPPIFEIPDKTRPPGLLMRGTRFVLYFGSVMLQVLSKMLSGAKPNLNQISESLVLN